MCLELYVIGLSRSGRKIHDTILLTTGNIAENSVFMSRSIRERKEKRESERQTESE
jgi:hypothetical protein